MKKEIIQRTCLFLAIVGLTLGLSGCSGASKSEAKAEPMTERASLQYQFSYEAYERGDLIPALSAVLESIKLSPNSPDSKNLLALIYFRQNKYKEAEKTFMEASALDPRLAEIHNNLGTLYYELKEYPKALASLQRALENPLYLYPERIYNNLGLVYAAMDNFQEARTAYEESIRLRKDFYLPFQNLGKLYLNRGDFVSAKNLLQQAVQLCAECSESRFHLGSLFLKENKALEARKLFKQGAALDPEGYFGQMCKQNLEKPAE